MCGFFLWSTRGRHGSVPLWAEESRQGTWTAVPVELGVSASLTLYDGMTELEVLLPVLKMCPGGL